MKLLLLGLFICALSYGETRVFSGIARSEGEAVYQVDETVALDEERPIRAVTFFTDRRGELLGKLTTEFYPVSQVPTFLMQDFRHKAHWGVRYKGRKVEMFRQKMAESEQTRAVKAPEQQLLLAGEGLSQFILAELDKILTKKRLNFWYLFPAQLEMRPFVMRVIAVSSDWAEIEIVSSYWWGRFLFGRQLFTIDRKNKFIRRIQGNSVLFGADGNALPVEVEFSNNY